MQPALFEKTPLSEVEHVLLAGYLQAHPSLESLTGSYEAMRRELQQLEARDVASVADCSRAFNGEARTTFSDIWHFSDPGHELLAQCMRDVLVKALRTPATPTSP
ncbi:MAG: hypothetical protein AB2A00_26600 [Myxococcota bacterium]